MIPNQTIRNRRLELGLTLKEVATALGTAESTVSRYETIDIQTLTIDKIVALAKVLECSPSYLLGWEEKEENLQTLNSQPNLFHLPIGDIKDATMLEIELVQVLRDLQKISPEEIDNLFNIFIRIPTLPPDLRKAIWEDAFIKINRHDRNLLQQQLHSETSESSSSSHLDLFHMLNFDPPKSES